MLTVLVFAHGFLASALHEIFTRVSPVKQKREQVDFGYWYCPDGRDAETKGQFEDVEVKPQAFDCVVARGGGFRSTLAATTWKVTLNRTIVFQRRVHAQVMTYLTRGIPSRPATLWTTQLLPYAEPLTAETIAMAGKSLSSHVTERGRSDRGV
ncbi:elongation factor P hydroxylase [Shigella flexneri]